MQKKDIVVGEKYSVRYGGQKAHRILAVNGYRPYRPFGEDHLKSRITAAPSLEGRGAVTQHLALRYDRESGLNLEELDAYTEQDLMDGKPVPAGGWVVTVTSRDIERTWAVELLNIARQQKDAEVRRQADTYRMDRLIPDAEAHCNRLSLPVRINKYSNNVSMSLEQFNALCERVTS
jgi:hypothetical protein